MRFCIHFFKTAGIDKPQLTLALEPESIYCQRESRINHEQSKLTKPKTRYLVGDIGGMCKFIQIYVI